MAKYIDADALLKDALKIGYWDNRDEAVLYDLIDSQPAADVEQVRRWIPCSEQLPENDLEVLAYYEYGTEKRVIMANFADGIWYDCIFNRTCSEITHWIPLPEPPKMDGGSEE